MDSRPYILLADDDDDDCKFFKEALEALPISAHLTFVNDGEELMQLLTKNVEYMPDVLFLDLNMPRKTGVQCLTEIKCDYRLKNVPVVIISTSYDPVVANLLYQSGASYYIRKPIGFSQLQELISTAILRIIKENIPRPEKENFLLLA
ncbi:Response regulator rcp1 [Arenibacter antarcticus]|uniref:Response regulator n=1 Tax=Arenibacter antarcticus TaxID=2040469 RepID=A0ABW5VEJ5_9FLAO|nr:response regulator [Arenibacter sp. H213]MCM4168451.1 response regulator [Arenibacter sp. H213]